MPITPETYGAVPDGTTDCYTALETAFDAAAAARDYVQLAPGSYAVSRVPTLRKYYPRMVGAGWMNTEIIPLGFHYGPLLAAYADETLYVAGGGATPVSARLGTALATGSGSAFQLSHVGSERQCWFNFRDAYAASRIHEASAFCAEMFVKVNAVPAGENVGALLTCGGTRIGTYRRAYGLSLYPKFGEGYYVFAGELTISGTRRLLQTTAPVSTATVYHLALSYDGTTMRLFLDGALVASGAWTGTITQQEYEEITLGPAMQQYPENVNESNGADAWVDSVRISNVVRYTSAFTAPTAKHTSDANTLMLCNFVTNYRVFTVAQTKDGDAHLLLRDVQQWEYIPQMYLANFGLGEHPFGSGGTSGLFLAKAIKGTFDHLRVDTAGNFGIYAFNNCYETNYYRPWIRGNNGRQGFVLSTAAGVSSVRDLLVSGMRYLAVSTVGGLWDHPWLEASDQTLVSFIADDTGGQGGSFTFIEPHADSEGGPLAMEAGFLFGPARAVTLIGGVIRVSGAAGTPPAIRLSSAVGDVMAIHGTMLDVSTGAVPIEIVTAPTHFHRRTVERVNGVVQTRPKLAYVDGTAAE